MVQMILEIGLSKTNLMIGGNVTDFDSEYDYNEESKMLLLG